MKASLPSLRQIPNVTDMTTDVMFLLVMILTILRILIIMMILRNLSILSHFKNCCFRWLTTDLMGEFYGFWRSVLLLVGRLWLGCVKAFCNGGRAI